MEVEVTFLNRRGTAVMRRSQRASAERVQLGRGTDNEVSLQDIRVGLHAAALVARDDGVAIEKLGAAPLIVNGQNRESALLRVGQEIILGPYKIDVTAPPEGCDAALQIELAQQPDAAGERMREGAGIGLEHTGANKRLASWIAFFVLLVVCLVAPVIVYWAGWLPTDRQATTTPTVPAIVGLSWNPGQFSNSHRFFSSNCATCHENAFTRVADHACLGCHSQIGSHLKPDVELGSFRTRMTESRCVDCHSEHRGVRGSVIRSAQLCLDCHRDLDKTAPAAGVQAATGYPDGHPQFRATLVADSANRQFARVKLDEGSVPVNHPGIKFSHALHLNPQIFAGLPLTVPLCSECHVAEPSGQGFLPITYKDRCQSCHQLRFDKVDLPWQDARVPHGDDTAVFDAVWNFYAAQALERGIAAAPAEQRRGPGMPPAEPSVVPPEALTWVSDKWTAALAVIFDAKSGCGECHDGTGPNRAFDTRKILETLVQAKRTPLHAVAPVMLQTRYLPNAVFDHARHRGVGCEECHTGRKAGGSVPPDSVNALSLEDVNRVALPGIETCERCHAGEDAQLGTASTCLTCHVFHRAGEFGPMHLTSGPMR
jgi:predicted CXXCH cytochrome family protein